MEINDIHKWLRSDRNYEIGVQIYEQFGTNKSLMALFSKSHNSFTSEKLLAKMRELAEQFPEKKLEVVPKVKKKKPVITRIDSFKPAVKNSELTDFSKLPPELIARHKEIGELVRKTEFLRNLLLRCPSDQRYTIASTIVSNHEKVVEHWMHIDYYNQNQTLLELKQRTKTDARYQQRIPETNKFQILLSLRSQISKLKNRIESEPDKKLALTDKLNNLLLRKKLLEKELK